VADGNGVWKMRSVTRKPISERWGCASLDMVNHPPWRTNDDDPECDGEMPEVIKLSPEDVKRKDRTDGRGRNCPETCTDKER
jgi:hypothetical protein